jgi:hypothetical protein
MTSSHFASPSVRWASGFAGSKNAMRSVDREIYPASGIGRFRESDRNDLPVSGVCQGRDRTLVHCDGFRLWIAFPAGFVVFKASLDGIRCQISYRSLLDLIKNPSLKLETRDEDLPSDSELVKFNSSD